MTEIWGIPITRINEYSKKYKFFTVLMYLIDILIMSLGVTVMFHTGAGVKIYLSFLVIVCLVVTLSFSVVINSDTGIAGKFYKKYKHVDVDTRTYNLDAQVLYNVLYCLGYKRLKPNKSMEIYFEMLNDICCDNPKCAFTMLKYLKKYEDEEGNYDLYITVGKKSAFIGVCPTNTKIDIIKETNVDSTLVEEMKESTEKVEVKEDVSTK